MSKNTPGKWTEDQAEAIRARGCSLLVSAAAGAGKTSVLVERILSRIKDRENPVDVDRLLVVTFTNAAAAEMRERIAAAISGELHGMADGGRLAVQLALLNRARITTIHSFCTDMLRQYFYRLDIDPGFRIADETESTLLKANVLEELLEEMYSNPDSGFAALADRYGGDLDDRAIMDLVTRIYDFSRSSPDPDRWLEKSAANFREWADRPSTILPMASCVLDEASRILEIVLADLESAHGLSLGPGGPAGYAPGIKEDIYLVQDLIQSCRAGWEEARRAFGEAAFATLKKAGSGVDEGLKKRVAAIRNRAKKKVKDLGAGWLSRSLEDHASDMKKLAPVMEALAGLVSLFAERYRRAKLSRGLADFGDLEHYCLRILSEQCPGGRTRPSPVALELQEQFEEVLVDEYQDINPVQEAIIKLVSRPSDRTPNLFMVGDVKQSIYRFRQADPTLFLDKYGQYSSPGEGPGRLIRLSRNFRSRRQIIEAVNSIFRRLMVKEAAELDYGPEAELVFGAVMYDGGQADAGADHRVELHLLERGRSGEEEKGPEEDGAVMESDGAVKEEFTDEDDPGAVQAEAAVAARRIRDLVDGGFQVCGSGGVLRRVEYRDVVVLMRATRGRAGIFLEELKKLGVPAYTEPDGGYFQSAEIETMVSLLKLVDNPRQDIPLAAVLRSPVVGLGCEDLAVTRMAKRGGDLWDAVKEASSSAVPQVASRLAGFVRSLDRWRDLARRSPMTDLIWTIYRETGYYNYAGSMPGGAGRQANLRALHHWAGQYESTTFRGIFSFLRFIDRMREKGEDPGRARTLGENENVVRIMSIHKSKGLEFPVVVVSGLGNRFNLMDLNRDILLHRELGFGPMLMDPEARVTYPTLARIAVREKIRREALAEEMRILYVAMTRAREKLIMTGSVAGINGAVERWSEMAPRAGSAAAILEAGSFLDWICPVLAGHSDGGALRPAGGGEEGVGEGLFSIRVAFPGARDSGREGTGGPSADILDRLFRGEKLESPGLYSEEVSRRLSWEYHARKVAGKPAKLTVTGIKAAAGPTPDWLHEEAGRPGVSPEGEEQAMPCLRPSYAKPSFMASRKDLTPAEKGSAVHLAMRHIDLRGRLDGEGISRQVDQMRTGGLITADQASAVDSEKVAAFFRSVLGQRMLSAKSVKRELPFSLLVSAGDLYAGLEGCHYGDRVLVQGVIDCLADEGDGYLLIDYKTDRLSGEGREDIAGRYRNQVEWYARAVETLTGRPVKDRYLFFFDAGLAVKV